MGNLSEISTVRSRPRQVARCAGSTKEQGAISAAGLAANGFLKHQFFPLYQQEGILPDQNKVEKGLLRSLSTLAGCYQFQPINVADKPYPYNILLAHWDAQSQIREQQQATEVRIVTDEDSGVVFSTSETVSTGLTLYYIPVLPLYRLLQDRRQKKCGELFLSVFSYLYHVAGIPYYRDKESYLFYHYEMIAEWIEDDKDQLDTTDYLWNKSALNKAEYYGEVLKRKLFNACHLDQFSTRLQYFIPQNQFQTECLQLAKQTFSLWQQYPKQSIFQHSGNVRTGCGDDEDNENYDPIRMEEYISFIAENEGNLYDTLSETVNSEFNEKASIEEPMITQLYTNRENDMQDDNLDFERKLFTLIDDLCTLLNELP